jgi:hypothetical protein
MVRPKKYATEEERLAARKESSRQATARYRERAREASANPAGASTGSVFKHVTFPAREGEGAQSQAQTQDSGVLVDGADEDENADEDDHPPVRGTDRLAAKDKQRALSTGAAAPDEVPDEGPSTAGSSISAPENSIFGNRAQPATQDSGVVANDQDYDEEYRPVVDNDYDHLHVDNEEPIAQASAMASSYTGPASTVLEQMVSLSIRPAISGALRPPSTPESDGRRATRSVSRASESTAFSVASSYRMQPIVEQPEVRKSSLLRDKLAKSTIGAGPSAGPERSDRAG